MGKNNHKGLGLKSPETLLIIITCLTLSPLSSAEPFAIIKNFDCWCLLARTMFKANQKEVPNVVESSQMKDLVCTSLQSLSGPLSMSWAPG